MKKLIQVGVWLIMIFLVVANIFIFVSGIILSDKIAHFERETKILHQENIELDKKISYVDSLEYAASMAASLDFVKKSSPVVLENLKYAFNK